MQAQSLVIGTPYYLLVGCGDDTPVPIIRVLVYCGVKQDSESSKGRRKYLFMLPKNYILRIMQNSSKEGDLPYIILDKDILEHVYELGDFIEEISLLSCGFMKNVPEYVRIDILNIPSQ